MHTIQIDDPVGVVPVHVVGSVWGMISPAIFICRELSTNTNKFQHYFAEIMKGFKQTKITIQILQHSPIGLRLSRLDEELGADLLEHGLSGVNLMTYTIEKKLTARELSAVMMIIVRWRAKAKMGTLRRRRVANFEATANAAPNDARMTQLQNRRKNSSPSP
uniref:Ammonium_transp domain-containing protein n=1 Tax=Angiostrongylus cantonensis TaxID=6313 RepID=A0A158P6J9_ANGCA